MINNYYKLPFGAQLLLWTSRIAFHGSCRASPNKYELIGMAYNKVGINNGCILLKNFLFPLHNNSAFRIQTLCKTDLIRSEIDLINCVHEHTKKFINNKYYIDLWSLDNSVKEFTKRCKDLANAFNNANLVTNIQPEVFKQNTSYDLINNTLVNRLCPGVMS